MQTKNNIRIIIAGGGTGGHIFPAIAIANAMKRMQEQCEILFVGAKGKMEMEKVPKEGYNIIGLDIAGFNRSSLLKNIFLPFKLLKSFLDASSIIKKFKPDIVVGVGGYASFPVLKMAQRKGIPTLIQEQNSFAGKSNKILGKKANTICVAYEGMERFFPKEKIVLTGNPVRASITNTPPTREQACQFFNLNPNQKIVFAFGGSLGAKSINETLASTYQQLVQANVQLIWQTGTPFYTKATEAVKGFESGIKVFEFIREMDMAYACADVIVSRAGASSISELCIIGKPVVFVPFPFASEDHQTHNAMALVNKQAALLVKDTDAQTKLMSEILMLLQNETLCHTMKKNIITCAHKHADDQIANKLIELVTT